MKKIISVLFLMFTFISFSESVSGKRIQVRGMSSKEISPDTAKLQLHINTENENLEKASKENVEIMEKYKSLLKKSNIKYENINSTNYNTYKTFVYEDTVINEGKKEHKTTLNVDVKTIDLSQLQTFISVLSKENILLTERNKDMSYSFNIVSQKQTSKEAYEDALNKFNIVRQNLSKKGFNEEDIKISGFENIEVNLEKKEYKKIEKNVVNHSFEIITRDLKNLGKLVDLASIIGIRATGYIEYDIDGKESVEDELYKKAYEEALKKAGTILNKTNLSLKKPVTITDSSVGSIRPYISYFNIKYFTPDKNIISRSDSKIIEEIETQMTVINPQKTKFSKMVYIEFEMD